jgi:hypothetical protein
MCALDLAFTVQHFVELRQRQLLVYRIRLHRFMQCFHGILQLPLQFVEARSRAIDLATHERLLLISQPQFSLMLHYHFWRKHRVGKRIPRHWWWRLLLFGSWRRRSRLLCRDQHHTQKQDGGEYCD